MMDGIQDFENAAGLFDKDEELVLTPISGPKRLAAQSLIERDHYTHTIPSGKSHWFYYRGAIVVFSIPANMNLGKFILKRECVCWELSRLWAKNGHKQNLLTEAIAAAIRGLKVTEPNAEVLVSFAGPNVGHEGFVYKASSWVYTGKSEDPRGYVNDSGTYFPRRSFHSGAKGLTKAEIQEQGFTEVFREGKHRFVKGLTKQAKKEIRKIWS